MLRKEILATDEVYHIFNKSIAGYTIFNNDKDFLRMLNVLYYYQIKNPAINFSQVAKSFKKNEDCLTDFDFSEKGKKLVDIIAYCLMPTHFHLILKQLKNKGISIFMNNVQNSYSRYFNIKYDRKGPLWEGPFKNVLVESDEQLLHLTRYIHLNPTTANIVKKPEKWPRSSYCEYIAKADENRRVCRFDDILDIEPKSYKEFVEDRISYQRELAEIKNLLLD